MTASAVAGVTYVRDASGLWIAPGRPSLTTYIAPASSRTTPARGTYLPNSPLWSGLLPGWTPAMLTPVVADAAGQISIDTGGTYRDRLFWGQVKLRSSSLATFVNCAFAGPDPSFIPGDGCIKNYGTGYYQAQITDSLIDPGLWMDPTVTRPGNASPYALDFWREATRGQIGIHGGRVTVQRCEFRNAHDLLRSVQDDGFTLLEDNWMHGNTFYKADGAVGIPVDGTHSDAIQFSRGHDLTFRGNYIGGVRDLTGYNATPVGYNSGDDAKNAGVMLKQEGSGAAGEQLDFITFEGNVFENGGDYCINHYDNPNIDSPMASSAIHDNFFVRRSSGGYVVRGSRYASLYSNNRVIDLNPGGGFTIGEPITYKNG